MRVALADDSALFRQGLAMLLDAAGVQVTAQVRTGEELLRRVATDPPDAVIVDIRMPPTFTEEGLATAEQLRACHPNLGVLVLSTYAETPYAVRLLKDNASGLGYLLKDRIDDITMLRDALGRVIAGEIVVDPEIVSRLLAHHRRASELDRLTDRERNVLRHMAECRAKLGIVQQLYLSAITVETHIANLVTKLGLPATPDDHRRVVAVLTWLRATTTDSSL